MSLRETLATMREWLLRLLGTFRRSDESDLESEIQYHLELAAEHLRDRGHSPTEASRLARARHGRPDQVVQRIREQRSIPWLGCFTLDVRLGLRMLRKYLGLTLIGGLAMSVGFAIIITVFMYFDVIVWSDSVPLDDGDRVVAIQIWDPESSRRSEIAVDDFERWRSSLTSFEDMGAFRTAKHDLVQSDGRIESISVAETSAAGFRVARVAPVLGRPLLAEDEQAGAAPVVVIGYDEWRARFAGKADVLGRTVRLDGRQYTIVGVMPKDFGFPINHSFWIPLRAQAGELLPAPPGGAVYGRLAAAASLDEAKAELSAAGLQPTESEGERSEPLRPNVVRYAANFIDDTSPDDVARRAWNARLVIFFVSLLLIPPCANIAMLVYARAVSRQEEIAIRTALGASRARIVLQLFIEMLLLTTLAVCLALICVRFMVSFFEQFMLRALERLPFWISFGLSANTLLFAALLAVLSALVIGLLPALKATSSFKKPGLSALDRRHNLRLGPIFTLLVVAQVAFSFAGLPSAIELAWGVLRSDLLGPGFAADEYLMAQISLDDQEPKRQRGRAEDATDAPPFRADLQALVRRLESDPRVSSRVTTGTAVPGAGLWRRFEIDGLQEFSGTGEEPGLHIGIPFVRQIGIDDQYFEVFDVSLLAGREFRTGESSETSHAVLVNATFAHDVFGDANPLGHRVRYRLSPAESAANPSDAEPWYEIVGVVADRPAHPYGGSVFHASAGVPPHPASIAFRAGPAAASLREELTRMASAIDPALRVEHVQTLEELYDTQAFGNYMGGLALITASLSVLLLAAAGTYALMTFTVNQRRREIAIRIALGAQPRRLLGTIFRRALQKVAVGAALGLAVALLVQREIPVERLGGLDVPGVLPSAIVLLLGIGAVAAIGPARRALTADPTDALREVG